MRFIVLTLAPAVTLCLGHTLRMRTVFIAQSNFTILHVANDMNVDWTEFPGVRMTLERWCLLSKKCSRSAVTQLGINISKVTTQHSDPVKSILSYLKCHTKSLIVFI